MTALYSMAITGCSHFKAYFRLNQAPFQVLKSLTLAPRLTEWVYTKKIIKSPLLQVHMDPVNVKPHFSLETTTLCSATQNHPAGVTHCLSRSKGRVRPEENSNPSKNVTGLFCVKEEQTNVKFSNSGIQSAHQNYLFFFSWQTFQAEQLVCWVQQQARSSRKGFRSVLS